MQSEGPVLSLPEHTKASVLCGWKGPISQLSPASSKNTRRVAYVPPTTSHSGVLCGSGQVPQFLWVSGSLLVGQKVQKLPRVTPKRHWRAVLQAAASH